MALKVRQTDQPAMVLLNIPTNDPKLFAYSTSYGCWLFHKNDDDVWDELHETHYNALEGDEAEVALEESDPEREGYPIEIPFVWGEFLTSITDKYRPTSMSCDVTKITITEEYSITDNWCVVIVPKVFTFDEAVTAFRDSVRAIFP